MSEAGLFQSRGATRQILLVLEGAESGSNTRQSRLRKTASFFFFFFFFFFFGKCERSGWGPGGY